MSDVPELRIPAEAGSVRRARHWVAFLARRHGVEGRALTLLELLTSEVVTNAVQHAPSTAAVSVRLRRVDHTITIEVDDDSSTAPQAVVRDPGHGGWGIRFVERMASDWGVAPREPQGKTVWFCLPLDGGDLGPLRPDPVPAERRVERGAGPAPAGPATRVS